MIGTTHFTNALIEARGLAPTAALRLGLPATASLPPMVDWPQRLVAAVEGRAYLAHGGHEFDGRHIAELDPDELRRHAADMAAHGIRSVAISSVFSPVSNEFELRAAQIIGEELGPDVAISLSHEIGRIGLLERENATIINAALRELACAHHRRARGVGDRPRHQRTVVPEPERRHPHGRRLRPPLPRGDVRLGSDELHAGRRTAVGPGNMCGGRCGWYDQRRRGSDPRFPPREATTQVDVAGIRTNFRMPDVLSIGIGGGSLVEDNAAGVVVGPRSVGYRLTKEALRLRRVDADCDGHRGCRRHGGHRRRLGGHGPGTAAGQGGAGTDRGRHRRRG